jgi:hypothetical protein
MAEDNQQKEHTDTVVMCTCSKCGQEKPLTKEYFYPKSKKRGGFESECKLCRKVVADIYKVDNREQYLLGKKNHYIRNQEYYKDYNSNRYREGLSSYTKYRGIYSINQGQRKGV